eukprot:3699032-Rhodomonas_salina.5
MQPRQRASELLGIKANTRSTPNPDNRTHDSWPRNTRFWLVKQRCWKQGRHLGVNGALLVGVVLIEEIFHLLLHVIRRQTLEESIQVVRQHLPMPGTSHTPLRCKSPTSAQKTPHGPQFNSRARQDFQPLARPREIDNKICWPWNVACQYSLRHIVDVDFHSAPAQQCKLRVRLRTAIGNIDSKAYADLSMSTRIPTLSSTRGLASPKGAGVRCGAVQSVLCCAVQCRAVLGRDRGEEQGAMQMRGAGMGLKGRGWDGIERAEQRGGGAQAGMSERNHRRVRTRHGAWSR